MTVSSDDVGQDVPTQTPPRFRAFARRLLSVIAATACCVVVLPAAAQAEGGQGSQDRRSGGRVYGMLQGSAAGTPRLSISAPTTVTSGRSATVTATISAVPSGQSVRVAVKGLACGTTRWVSSGVARTSCAFRPTRPGGYRLTANATLYSGSKRSGSASAIRQVTAIGVQPSAPVTVRRGVSTRLRFAVGTAAKAGATVRLTTGVTGATGCPSSVQLRVDLRGSATYTCTVTPDPVPALRVAPQAIYGSTTLVATAISREVQDGPRLSVADAEAAWREVTERQFQRALATEVDSHESAAIGFEIMMRAHRDGWDDPSLPPLVHGLLDLRNPDGGWGLEKAWDAFGDRTVNPATTTYTVTTAAHVGPALLGAWQHGLVSDDDLRWAVDSLLATPTWPVPGGLCVSYSTSPYDTGTCVVNVSLGAAAWLKQVREATGWSITRLDEVVAGVTGASRYLFLPESGYWGYSDLPTQRDRPQDPAHQGYTLESVLELDPALAETAVAQFLRPWWLQPDRYSTVMYGNGQSQVAFTDCSGAARSPALLEAFRSITAEPDPQARFLSLQYALHGQRTIDTCFAGKPW